MKRNLALVAIVLIAVILRFYQLGSNPPSLTWDEAAWGYNAYSLGIDGKDEFGRFLPLDYIESFGDFKPPVYAYLTVLPVKTFGLNEFAVRFSSAFFGVLTVLLTYFLVNELFRKREVALLTSFFLAISPWHINLSRAAFEANVATFFIILGVFLFVYAISRRVGSLSHRMWNRIDTSGILLLLAVISFALSMYTFNTARVVSPLLVVILSIGFWKRLWEMKKETAIALIVGFIVLLPLLNFLLYPQASLRFREVNIFSDIEVIRRTNQQMANNDNAWWSNIVHNRRFAYSAEYLKHYFDHFKPSFLFINGDGNPKFSTQDVGSLYLWELPFFVIGILFLFRQRIGRWWFVPLWLLIGIIPAATARETPHVLRIESTLPTFQILVAYGVYQVVSGIKYYVSSRKLRNLILATLFLLLFINVAYYLHGYYVHYPREYSGEWQYGYKESIEFVDQNVDRYEDIYITTELGRPHIYYLFYLKVSPREYRKTAEIKRDTFGFVHVERLGKYHFVETVGSIASEEKKNSLFIDVPKNIPGEAKIIKTFYSLNKKPALVAYEVR